MLQQVSRHQLSWFALQDGGYYDDDIDEKREREKALRAGENEAGMKTHPREGEGCAQARASRYLGHRTRDLFDFDQDDIRGI